jgi:signal transduction histidine kinase
MVSFFINGRTVLALLGILIVSSSIFYSSYLAKKIAKEERKKVAQWVEASSVLLSASTNDTKLPIKIMQDNDDIPLIWTNEKDSIIDTQNIDTAKIAHDKNYVVKKLKELKATNEPIIWQNPLNSTQYNKYYFGHTRLLNEVRYYPIVQLIIVGLFIIITLIALSSNHRSVQNQVWAGMAKETAHQLGTPISSLQGWLEMLKENKANDGISIEIQKDVDRLKLVSDRFGKIGSTPQLEWHSITDQVMHMVEYIRKRATGKVQILVQHTGDRMATASISPPLFDWVIENLLKNALDAMEGKGIITIHINAKETNVAIDVSDTGKGIFPMHLKKVFNPGFTTKKRGWGLGLSLSKRIIEQYHQGKLSVKNSEVGKGTTFSILLPRQL